jgi:hypothetical protein
MNDAWGYDDNAQIEPGHNDGSPKALRDAYNALKNKYETEVGDLNTKLTGFIEEQRREKLSSVFSELGVPGAASLYTGEPDPEKAKAWATSMKAAFGTGNAQGEAPVVPSTEPALDAQVQQQYQQMTEAGTSGAPLGNFQAAEAAVGNATDFKSIMAAMQQAQAHMST